MKIILLDTETTGVMPQEDRLVSLAYKADGEMRYELYKPPKDISVGAMATHHITPAMVEKKEAFPGSALYSELEELLPSGVLVAHNAAYDIGILENEGLAVPQFICTMKVAKALDKEGEIPRYAMQYLRYHWMLKVGEAVAHSADGDVLVLEALFEYLKEEMLKQGKTEDEVVTEMMEISVLPSLIQRFYFGKYREKRIEDVAKKDPGYLEWLLGQKEAGQGGEARYDDADMIFSLKHYLGRST